jgi:hypothetical protein
MAAASGGFSRPADRAAYRLADAAGRATGGTTPTPAPLVSDTADNRYGGQVPSSRQARDAADRIAMRRYEARDPDLSRLEDGLLSIAAYAGRYQRVPEHIRRADVTDALVILDHLRALLDSNELAIIEMGRAAGMTWQDLATARGLSSRQGAETAYRRLRNAVRGSGTKDHERERASRQNDRELSRWLRRNTSTLCAAALRINTARDRLPADLVTDMDELIAACPTAGVPATPAFAARLALFLDEVQDRAVNLPPTVAEVLNSTRTLLSERP